MPDPVSPALAGLIIGLVFGVTVQRTSFCTMGAIADLVLFNDRRRLQAWLLAIGVALLGTQALDLLGLIDTQSSLYRQAGRPWLLMLTGGLLFGFGMTLCGGCLSKTLVRLGGGSRKAALVLVMVLLSAGLTLALLSQTGLARVPLGPAVGGVGAEPAAATGAPLRALLTLVLAAALLGFCLRDARFRAARVQTVAGSVIGLCVPLAWLAGGAGGWHAGINFVTPALQLALDTPDPAMTVGLGIVLGTPLGAFGAALLTRSYRVERFDHRSDTVRHLIGGLLMGAGGTLALGCTIGQGISGVSALAPGSLVTLIGLIAGAVLGVRYLESGSLRAALRALTALG